MSLMLLHRLPLAPAPARRAPGPCRTTSKNAVPIAHARRSSGSSFLTTARTRHRSGHGWGCRLRTMHTASPLMLPTMAWPANMEGVAPGQPASCPALARVGRSTAFRRPDGGDPSDRKPPASHRCRNAAQRDEDPHARARTSRCTSARKKTANGFVSSRSTRRPTTRAPLTRRVRSHDRRLIEVQGVSYVSRGDYPLTV